MVAIHFRSFDEYKAYILGLGVANPNRAAPYRFHRFQGANIDKMAEVYAGGGIILLYDAAQNEVILPSDPWFKANPQLNYPASVAVLDMSPS